MTAHPFRFSLRLALLGAMLVLFSTVGCSQYPPGVSIGKKAPEVAGADVTGKAIQLTDYKDKVVLLDFWGTWCGPCVQMIPKEMELMRLYGKRRFIILGVCQDNQENLRQFLEKKPLPWPNILENKGNILRDWGVQSFPTWVLIDDEGIIRGRWEGGGEIANVEQAVEKAVKIAETR